MGRKFKNKLCLGESKGFSLTQCHFISMMEATTGCRLRIQMNDTWADLLDELKKDIFFSDKPQ